MYEVCNRVFDLNGSLDEPLMYDVCNGFFGLNGSPVLKCNTSFVIVIHARCRLHFGWVISDASLGNCIGLYPMIQVEVWTKKMCVHHA
jgi:hypothetical protein